LPFALYLVFVVLCGDWIIDDAGISFAYARNVAHGEGFVSQPGRVPVEGFSNFLWVLALVPTFWLHLFDPVVTPKVLGALAVLGAFALVGHTLRRRTGSLWPGVVVTTLFALSPPLVIWSVSGLENGLLLLLVAAFFALAALRPPHWQAGAGLCAALLAMTRPDALVFAAAGLLLSVGDAVAARRTARAGAASVGRFVGTFVLFALPFFAFRLAVFHRPWPHTYYAKREFLSAAERLNFFADRPGALWDKLAGLGQAIAGPLGVWLLLASFVAVAWLALRKRLRFELWVASLLQLVSVAAFVWLEDDWMGEHRFATAAIATSLVTLVLASFALVPRRPRHVALGWAFAAVLALFELAPRLVRFAAHPPTPYADVVRQSRRFDAYADALGLEAGSILTADIGGALMESRLAVYDAAGLTEPEIVRTLKRGTPIWYYDHPLFYDWVLDTVRPTFVTTRKFWTNVTALEQDPRFLRDYVAIDAYPDAYVARVYGRSLRSGDFVRREALTHGTGAAAGGEAEALDRLRAVRSPERPDPFVVRLADGLGLGDAPGPDAPPEELRRAATLARLERNDPDRAATLLGRLLARVPGDRRALAELGEALDDAGRSGEARVAGRRLLTAAHGDAARDRELVARARARLGLDEGSPPEAEQRRLVALGLEALYTRRDAEAAIALFGRVLAENPTHYGATFQLAKALELAGREQEARAAWGKVLEMAEGYGDAATAAEARSHLGP
ncbi:MAG: hypothetical protein IT373_20160, partial [Polyangiaceae bacterium]|nr:hypothetical protein [Polyangiaceae bacterium]